MVAPSGWLCISRLAVVAVDATVAAVPVPGPRTHTVTRPPNAASATEVPRRAIRRERPGMARAGGASAGFIAAGGRPGLLDGTRLAGARSRTFAPDGGAPN